MRIDASGFGSDYDESVFARPYQKLRSDTLRLKGLNLQLVANGENVKVVQELMRPASSRCTLEVCSQAHFRADRHAADR